MIPMSVQQIENVIVHLNAYDLSQIKEFVDRRVTRNALIACKIGDNVSFSSRGQDYTGIVHRVNMKTFTIDASDGRRWRVSHRLVSKS